MRRLGFSVIAIALLTGCVAPQSASVEFFAMDTYMAITAYGKSSKDSVEAAKREILLIEEGVTIPDTLSTHITQMREIALQIYDLTDGAFDITLAPVVRAWGFGPGAGEHRVPSYVELEVLLANRNADDADYGGIAKGYAADRAAEILRNGGNKSALLDLGGNIYAVGHRPDGKPWSVAVQDPADPDGYVGILSLTDEAAVTSGAYQRYFEENGKIYHHIIAPATGYPADSGLSSVTVVCKSAAVADALSTAFFVVGSDRAVKYWKESILTDSVTEGFGLVLVEDGGKITITPDLEGQFASEREFEVAR
jgi:thiamine biosynthesis lipoprotein